MKQLLFLVHFLAISGFSQSIDIGLLDKIKRTHHDPEHGKLYVFYQDSLSVIDLDKLNEISRFPLKTPSETFYEDFEPVSLNASVYFIERLGGRVYHLANSQIKRIDNSFSHKMQIRSTIFNHNDTIFRYGGYGFWSVRNFFTYFKKSNKEWELVVPRGSEVFPRGSMLSTVKIINTDFYVFGGLTLIKSNPLENQINDEVWKFRRDYNSWEFLGNTDFRSTSYDIKISYDEDHIFMNLDKDEVYLVDIYNNQLKTFSKTGVQRNIIQTFNSFYRNGKFYLFTYKSSSSKEVKLVTESKEDFFGELKDVDEFYFNDKKIFYFLYLLLFSSLLVIGFFKLRKIKFRRKRILAKKENVSYKGRSLGFDENSLKVINLLLRSDKEVQYKDILEITENKNLNYAHNTKVMNATLEEINFKLKSTMNIDEDIITFKKSDLDKRIKVYDINKSYFVIK